MINLQNVAHHPCIDEIVDVLCNRTQNTDKGFFRVELAYFLGKLASCMRVQLLTKDRGKIPVNIYALALAGSGHGKGYSVNIIEEEFIKGFKNRFIQDTMPLIADENLWDIANTKAAKGGTDPNDEHMKLDAEYKRLGAYPFTFDSGTSPAVKQLRQKLLLANCGAINLQIDEIGSNLIGATEVLNTFLELYDQGMIKQKLTKNTNDNIRSEDLDGKTPTNMLLFGTPIKLLDGGSTEDQFYSFLEIGYARRCIFGIGHTDKLAYHNMTAQQIFANLTQPSNTQTIRKWSNIFTDLADPTKYGWEITVPDNVAIELLQYKIDCEKIAEELADHEEIRKAELSHRYFKALKLAGAYAFIDGTVTLTMNQLHQAILLVEESGSAFQSILTREKAYMKLARYLANVGIEVTHADLNEALPFYKSSVAARNEMMSLAQAWGYKRHIIIKKSYVDSIELFKGETLKETNLDEMILSYSNDFAYNYSNEYAPWNELPILTQANGLHWCNHHFKDGHRKTENAKKPFNMLIIDCDGEISHDMVKELLKDYKFMTYTTKRHTEEQNRFRLIMPINYILEMDQDEYREFMDNVINWLPFKTDEAANQIAKKWESCDKGTYYYNEGKILDASIFIPRTSRNEQFQKDMSKIENMDALERWFAQRMAMGNRNNNMLKYALALVDGGMALDEVNKKIYSFNKKLINPLPEAELEATILVTVAKKYLDKGD